MNITPVSSVASHKQGTLINQTPESIAAKLGFKCNVQDDPYKVKYSWEFEVAADAQHHNAHKCAIWDWKGSAHFGEFSFYGSREVFEQLFPGCVR